MKTKKYLKRFYMFIIAIILAIVVGLPFYTATVSAFGDTSDFGDTENGVSNVLDDLKKDESFDTANYPAIADDYSVQVIQIA